MQESHTALRAGQSVVVRDERWTVLDVAPSNEVALVSLRGIEDANRDEVQAVITNADVIQQLPQPSTLRQRSRRAVLAAAAAVVAEAAEWDECWTATHARIDLRDWQLEPARAAVRGAMRILLADEVGLGKTIQAALILTELRARGLAERALVLTPASIREQWAGEFSERFGLRPVVFDQARLAMAVAGLPPGLNPWATEPLIISSIDLVKRPEVRAALESVPFDVLIVDEAHHLTPGTDRSAVVAELAQRTPWIVLATATPHNGDDDACQFLQGLGDVGTEVLTTFCRSRRVVAKTLSRRSRLLFVQPTAAERTLLDATRDYARALASERTAPGRHLIASVVSRRAASSAQAVHNTFIRRIALLAQTSVPAPQTRLPWEEDDSDEVSDGVLGGVGLGDVVGEIDWLRRLADLALAARSQPSKVSIIRRLLRRTREPLIVFSEYRDVVSVVTTALADLCTVAPLHGGLSIRERRETVRAFIDGRTRVLVATDAAGEGLNLQAGCRLVVNMELPWTPRTLEQRIGRVDRLGQQRRVHAIHLAHRGSYEGTVIVRLERRRGRMGIRRETDVDPSPAGHARSVRMPSGARAASPRAVYATRSRMRRSRMWVVYLVTLVDAAGRLVERGVVARHIEITESGHRLSRQLVRQVIADRAVRATLASQIAGMASTAFIKTTAAAAAMNRRLEAQLSHLDQLSEPRLWQASLFDRRTEQRAHARRCSIDSLRQHLCHRVGRVQALGSVTPMEPQLIAAWLE